MTQQHRSDVRWRTSTSCGADACVEVALTGHGVAIRDSKDPDGPVLHYDHKEWDAFLDGAKRGEFDTVIPS